MKMYMKPENTETEAYTDESEVQEISPDEVLQNFANENIWSVNAQVSSRQQYMITKLVQFQEQMEFLDFIKQIWIKTEYRNF